MVLCAWELTGEIQSVRERKSETPATLVGWRHILNIRTVISWKFGSYSLASAVHTRTLKSCNIDQDTHTPPHIEVRWIIRFAWSMNGHYNDNLQRYGYKRCNNRPNAIQRSMLRMTLSRATRYRLSSETIPRFTSRFIFVDFVTSIGI